MEQLLETALTRQNFDVTSIDCEHSQDGFALLRKNPGQVLATKSFALCGRRVSVLRDVRRGRDCGLTKERASKVNEKLISGDWEFQVGQGVRFNRVRRHSPYPG